MDTGKEYPMSGITVLKSLNRDGRRDVIAQALTGVLQLIDPREGNEVR